MSNKRKVIAWLLFIFWIGLIFYMSNQPGEVSSQHSQLVIAFFEFLGIDLTDKLGSLATFIVRKTAHFSEYFILYFLTLNLFKCYLEKKYVKWCSLLFVFAYACSDEIHQYFIPGRAMALRDVFIDTMGGFTAWLVSIFYVFSKTKH